VFIVCHAVCDGWNMRYSIVRSPCAVKQTWNFSDQLIWKTYHNSAELLSTRLFLPFLLCVCVIRYHGMDLEQCFSTCDPVPQSFSAARVHFCNIMLHCMTTSSYLTSESRIC
jgi:hypothetical protein